ncbi:hypothetical protein [Streptomyces xiaopingdaonensis]|uniref:hypothetical protein n=1 Tax=Streptomyces xiaopingdaonensis TaxID=1565415 RepID=UPI00030BA666|nr:hypothetical protein [Streptomyces xiaopingdaonensis]
MKRSGIRKLVLAAGVVAAVTAVVALRQDTAEPPSEPSGPAGSTSTSEVRHNQGDGYWTDRRMREAEPAPMPGEE